MHAIISLATNQSPAPEQTLQLAEQGRPVEVGRAGPCHHHQHRIRFKQPAVRAKELTNAAFDPVARDSISDLAGYREAEPASFDFLLPGHMAHKVTSHHTLAPLEDKLVFRCAPNARGRWKPMGARHNWIVVPVTPSGDGGLCGDGPR